MKYFTYALMMISLALGACNEKVEKKEIVTEKAEAVYSGKNQLTAAVWYQNSAENKAIYLQTYKLAESALIESMKGKHTKPVALITDLDETAVDNSPFNARLAKTGELYTKELWSKWVSAGKAKALPGAVEFFNFAKESGVEVFYLSNRHIKNLVPTMENMTKLGFPNVEEKFFYLKTETSNKTVRRDSILKNYDVIMYLGDNLNDFTHEFGDRDSTDFGASVVEKHKADFGSKFIIFPNPMYGEWEKAAFHNDYGKTPAEKIKTMLNDLDDSF